MSAKILRFPTPPATELIQPPTAPVPIRPRATSVLDARFDKVPSRSESSDELRAMISEIRAEVVKLVSAAEAKVRGTAPDSDDARELGRRLAALRPEAGP